MRFGNLEQIRTDICNWLAEHPYAKDVTSGALEAIPYLGPALRNILERSTKLEDDRADIIQFLRSLQNASDEQLLILLRKLDEISGALNELSLDSLRILGISEETNAGVKEIIEKVDVLLHRSEQAKAGFWKQFALALDALEELISSHVKLINRTLAPLLEGRPNGLADTAEQFRTLVFNSELPQGYARAHAHLDEWTSMEEFRGEVNHARLNATRTELYVFQYAVFPMMSQSGYFGDFGFGSAAKLWLLLTQDSTQNPEKEKLQTDIRANFLLAFDWLTQERSWHELHDRKLVKSRLSKEEYERMLEISQLNVPDGVLKPVCEWCREWQYLVNQQLWTGALETSIARLRSAAHDRKVEIE